MNDVWTRLHNYPSWYAAPEKARQVRLLNLLVIGYGILAVLLAVAVPGNTVVRVLTLGLWSIVPPIVMAAEYYLYFDQWGIPPAAEKFRDAQTHQTRVWVGGLILLYSLQRGLS
jgi:hypothetical protein